jgi:hypothetical protein
MEHTEKSSLPQRNQNEAEGDRELSEMESMLSVQRHGWIQDMFSVMGGNIQDMFSGMRRNIQVCTHVEEF